MPIFEYHPYYSNRAHKYLNENKTTIKNLQFKKNYFKFLFIGILTNNFSTEFKLGLVYYFLLQDRIDEASNFYETRITKMEKDQHKLQVDYIECFFDMYKGYPTFEKARKIVQSYLNYPVISWRKLFKDIHDTLK